MTALALAVLLASSELLAAQAPRAMGMAPRRIESRPALPDLRSVPVPVLDVFEPAVARQLEQTRKNAEELAGAGRRESVAVFGMLCMLYLRYELFDAAEPCLREARRLEPRDFRWPYYQTYVYTRAGDLERARKSAAAALDLRPDDVATLLRAGDLALLAQDVTRAEAAYSAALDAAPDSSAARFGLGRVASARGDHAGAAERFASALSGQPEGTIVHYHLGLEYRALGDLDRAREELAKNGRVEIVFEDPFIAALSDLSESRETTFAAGIEALERGRNDEAIAAFERVLELDPKDAQAQYNLARAQIETNDLERAESHLRAAIDVWPEFFDAHLNLAILLGRTGRSGEAAEHVERAVKIDPEHVPTRLLHARVLSQRGDQAAAALELAEVLRLDPASIEARMGLATTLILAADYPRARAALEEGTSRFPDNLPIQHLLARVLATCPDSTVRDGARALKIARGLVQRQLSIDHVETLAMALAEVGDWEEAAMWQRRAIERETATGASTEASRRRLELYEARRPVREPWKERSGATDLRLASPR